HDRGVLLAFETRKRFDEHCESLPALESAGHHPQHLHGDEVQEAEPALSDRIRHGLFFPADRQIAPDSLNAGLLAKLAEVRVAVTPLNGMLRLAGTMEFGSTDDSVNEIRVEAIRRAGREAFHAWRDGEGERTPWAGSRPMTPDGLPVIGRLDSVANAYVNSGHSMLGLTLAPGSARLLAELMTDGSPSLSAEQLAKVSPNRF